MKPFVGRAAGYVFFLVMVLLFPARYAVSQTAPTEGLRDRTPSIHALINARLVPAPGKIVENATLVLRDGIIEGVGNVRIPPDARVWDMKGMTVYPGFIDASTSYGMSRPVEKEGPQRPRENTSEARGTSYWNPQVLAHQNATSLFLPDPKFAEKLRSQGITTVLTLPAKGIFRGTGAVVNTGDGTSGAQVVRERVFQSITFERDSDSEGYPSSLMGTIALIRQTLYDAGWSVRAQDVYRKNNSLPRPETLEPLSALAPVLTGKQPVLMEASDELNFLRADALAREFGLTMFIRGSGHEYKLLDAVKATGRGVVLPVNFPDPPSVQTPEEALEVSLSDLRYWDEAPDNPAVLHRAGIPIALTSALLKDPGQFIAQVRKAVERGLSPDAALAALTTTPSKFLGIEKQLGTLEQGKIANIVVTDGDLFSANTKIRETWIDGKRYQVKTQPEMDPRGTWLLHLPGAKADSLLLEIKGEIDGLQGSLKTHREVKLKSASIGAMRLLLSFSGDTLGFPGIVRMTGVISADTLTGTGEWADGKAFSWLALRKGSFIPEQDSAKQKKITAASFPPVQPHGEYGRQRLPEQHDVVLVRGATLWTCTDQGVIRNADLLVHKGKITAVGQNISAPAGAMIIDGTGRHVTPGLIDAHSHTSVSGSVNEGTQAISAEVRVGDIISNNDIDVYRGLAGGLTTAHVLHGSANPIGGQSQLIKLRWGMLPEEMKFEGAPPTIKFALGENVKQSNWGDRFTTRYPQTRMGVAEIIRDQFAAAKDYQRAWQKYERDGAGIPPRRDLELDAIVEILNGKRFIHCHSYRQDEILMLIRLADEMGFQVTVFQHILEGYKVADAMAHHGAGGSSFSDWWGYKLEVYDAIPHNGALMHEQGVLVSFNSDSEELARRMNLEAAKAVKYGGLSEEEALKFVTLNPAKQLKVDHRVGSLSIGKDADFVIWSGHPLSTYSRCEQTWVDGRRYFDLGEDAQLRQQSEHQRATLIQKALETKKTGAGESVKTESRSIHRCMEISHEN